MTATDSTQSGGCQCGAVRYHIEGAPLGLAVCHCTECQRQSGSAFGMSLIVRAEQLTIEGTLKTFSRPSDAGPAVECAFCPECGTRIYHRPTRFQGLVNIKPGTLDDTSQLKPALVAWVEHKQPWVPLPQGIATHSRQP